MSEVVERAELVDGLRRAVGRLYNCRYSEVPLAQELDALLKRETGRSYGEWVVEQVMPAPITDEDRAWAIEELAKLEESSP